VTRARLESVPVVLGSATPSLESELNCRSGRYRRLELPDRAGGARMPAVAVIDLGAAPRRNGLTPQATAAVRERLERGEQSLVFINRRGFAPLVMCRQCGWRASCQRCDARMVLHRRSGRIRCHHCGAAAVVPTRCPDCDGADLSFVGEGSQRLQESLEQEFSGVEVVRIDRDAVRGGESLEAIFERVRRGDARILVGTQMLSKGHDFPGVTLVCIVNADQGLYSLDFRASERLYQQVVQVAGRAGRADRPGTVLIQTFHPDEARLALIAAGRLDDFVDQLLAERSRASYPPFARLALVRAEAMAAERALDFLRRARVHGLPLLGGEGLGGVALMDAVPSPMERRAGRYRAQLLVRSRARGPLHRFLDQWLPAIESLPEARRVRWSVDVDPMDLF
jgi:primosomal protein N' (replication factor Y)